MEKVFFLQQNVGFRIRDLREKRGSIVRKAPTREAPPSLQRWGGLCGGSRREGHCSMVGGSGAGLDRL